MPTPGAIPADVPAAHPPPATPPRGAPARDPGVFASTSPAQAVVSLGRHQAIGRVAQGLLRRGLTLQGLSARLAYWALQRRHMVTLHGALRTMLLTLGGWLAGRSQPRVKLH